MARRRCSRRSSLTGQTSKELATAYTDATKRQWTQPIGFAHALFEVALDTIVGHIAWGKGPNPNVAKTVLVGDQWRKGEKFDFDLVVTINTGADAIPVGGKTIEKVWP